MMDPNVYFAEYDRLMGVKPAKDQQVTAPSYSMVRLPSGCRLYQMRLPRLAAAKCRGRPPKKAAAKRKNWRVNGKPP